MAIIKKKSKTNAQFVQELTTWRNDLQEVQRFTLFPPGNMNMRGYEVWEVELQPGEEVIIPSEHDHVIQMTHPQNPKLVIGGLAPRLTKVGKKGMKLHEALDVEFQEKKANLKKVVEIQLQKKMMEETLRMSQEDMKKVLDENPLKQDDLKEVETDQE